MVVSAITVRRVAGRDWNLHTLIGRSPSEVHLKHTVCYEEQLASMPSQIGLVQRNPCKEPNQEHVT